VRNFILGVIVTVVVIVVGGFAFAMLGLLPTNADATPPSFERNIAMHALDASMDHHAPRVNNPVPATDDNLIQGMKIYTMNCALCHGSLDYKSSPLANSFYPPVPQLIANPLDDPEWHIYYAVRTGVRYTGMPAWSKALTDDQIWKVTGFLAHLGKLSPAVQDYWKKSYGVEPHTEGAEEHEHHEH
jgi:mono/diheme cytochrome c family protein